MQSAPSGQSKDSLLIRYPNQDIESIIMKKILVLFFLLFTFSQCYHQHPVKTLPEANHVHERTLFIAVDGIDYALMAELKKEGHFRDFLEPVPLVATFPSATTIGFTGIFQPLNVGKVPGYEVRFYSYDENRIMGGTPLDIYKIPINYKYYFDNFRHTMQQKAIMYTFPSMASRQDLENTKKVVQENPKQVLMTYLGGTDGSAHMLGRNRTKRTLAYMDEFLQRLQKNYIAKNHTPLRIVLFSDHGFQYSKLKTVSNSEIKSKLSANGFHENTKLDSEFDVVFVKFGLLSAGVGYVKQKHAEKIASILSTVDGIDMSFWASNDKHRIYIRNSAGAIAYFEYNGALSYRYVPQTGDPLNYVTLLHSKKLKPNTWISDHDWKSITYNANYPDAGFRLYDSFFNLVANKASVQFSLKPNYQFGATPTRIATWPRFGQRGTHGGLFRQTSWAFAMSNLDNNKNPPKFFRYDEMFRYYLPVVTNAYQKEIRQRIKTISSSPDLQTSIELDMENSDFKKQLALIKSMVMELE